MGQRTMGQRQRTMNNGTDKEQWGNGTKEQWDNGTKEQWDKGTMLENDRTKLV